MKLNFLPFLILLNLLLLLPLSGQELSEVKPLAEEIIIETQSGNYDKVLDETYPRVFEIASREQLKEIINQTFDSEEVKIKILPTNYDVQVEEVREIGGKKFVKVHYNMLMSMQFLNLDNEEEEVDAEMLIGLMQMELPQAVIKYLEADKLFMIQNRMLMVAISDEYTNGKWKFMNADKTDNARLKLFFDEEILKYINND